MMMEHRARGGFTLIELLLVVAIIAALAGIIAAVTAPAREAARRTQCIAQIRQLVLAVRMYEDDYDNPPIHRNWPPEGNVQRILLTLRYVTDPRIFVCPSDPRRGLFYLNDWDWDGVRMSYFYGLWPHKWERFSSLGFTQLADNSPLWLCDHHPGGAVIGEHGGRTAYMTHPEWQRRYDGSTGVIFEGLSRCMQELIDEYGPDYIHHLSECGGSAPTEEDS